MNEQWETQLQQRLEQRLSGLNQDLERVWWKDGAQVRARGVQLTMHRMWLVVVLVPVILVVALNSSAGNFCCSTLGASQRLRALSGSWAEKSLRLLPF